MNNRTTQAATEVAEIYAEMADLMDRLASVANQDGTIGDRCQQTAYVNVFALSAEDAAAELRSVPTPMEQDAELGEEIRQMFQRWTADDETPGEASGMGSGADVVQELSIVLARHGMVIS